MAFPKMVTNYRVIGPDSWHTDIQGCQIREDALRHVVVENGYVVPVDPSLISFVMDAGGRVITASQTTRYKDPVDKGQSRRFLRRFGKDNARDDDRTCVFLGPVICHYGHFLLESLSRLWYTPPQDAVLVFAASPNIEVRNYMMAYWSNAGLELSQVEFVTSPTRFRRVIVPEAAFRVGRYAHIGMREVYQRITRNVCREPRAARERIYLSRSRWENTRNENDLEAALSAQGFRVVHPQDLSIEEQIEMISGASEIVGRWGSAMHNVVFANPGVKIVHLFADRFYTSYYLTDQLAQAKATYVLAEPGAPRGKANIDIDQVVALVKAG